MAKPARIHIFVPVGHPKHPGTVTAVPLLCGRRSEFDTKVSYAIEKVTCGQCQNLFKRFQEDQLAKIPIDRAALQEQLQVDG